MTENKDIYETNDTMRLIAEQPIEVLNEEVFSIYKIMKEANNSKLEEFTSNIMKHEFSSNQAKKVAIRMIELAKTK